MTPTHVPDARNPWKLYDELIEGVPEGIRVLDFCRGASWSYVRAECGMGISKTVTGGAVGSMRENPLDFDLRSLAKLVKSWNFGDATLGIAALNAWYARLEAAASFAAHEQSGQTPDAGDDRNANNPFHSQRERYEGKKVAVIGHFPNVAAMAKVADLTVLERNCTSGLDTPDPACEYVLPFQDFVFLTGTTLTNKTAPRLLELSREAEVIMTGPSAVPALALFDRGVDMIAGSYVVDCEQAALAVRGGSKQQWRAGIKKFSWRKA